MLSVLVAEISRSARGGDKEGAVLTPESVQHFRSDECQILAEGVEEVLGSARLVVIPFHWRFSRGIGAMMGEPVGRQDRLFHEFDLEVMVPADHLLRRIDAVLELSWRRTTATPVARRSIRSC